MKAKTLVTLEFAKIQERLAAYTATPMGRSIAENLRPGTNLVEITQLHEETAEAVRLVHEANLPSLAGAQDIRPAIRHGAKGGSLDTRQLLTIAATAAISRDVRLGILRESDAAPALARIAQRIEDFKEIEEAIDKVVGADARVKDDASEYLHDLREETRGVHQQIQSFLSRAVTSPQYSDILQESVITQRSGRYVLPVRAERRSALPGILHDVSATGATIFVEPMQIVEHGNRQRELQAEEEREVRRILQRTTQQVVRRGRALSTAVRGMARLDLTFAKARYAVALKAISPHVTPRPAEGSLRLVDARHPLLQDDAVPISLEVGEERPILLVTGPNTGGKTVALKTAGLLAMMSQAGLHVPAGEGTRLPIFRDIFADIGDEQSIEQSLSTFSGHMSNIVEILRDADRNTLVLLDELGSGTDPAEGSALAQSVLEYLLRRNAATIATTHHSDLKAFAHVTPGVRNASAEFDPVSLQPTYRLLMDIPGTSNALSVARRLGLRDDILERAQERLGQPHEDMEQLLTQIQQDRVTIEDSRKAAEEAAAEVERLRESLEVKLAEADQEKARAVTNAQRQMVEESRHLQARLRRIRASLNNNVVSVTQVPEVQREIEQIQQEIAAQAPATEPPAEVAEAAQLRVGGQVWLPEMGVSGTLLSEPSKDGEIEVQIGSIRARLLWHQVQPTSPTPPPPTTAHDRPRAPAPEPFSATSAAREVSLRGMRYEEAEDLLERTIHDAFIADMGTLHVVHGKGMGILKKMTQEMLRNHPLVESFQIAEHAEGGDGVTVARLSRRHS